MARVVNWKADSLIHKPIGRAFLTNLFIPIPSFASCIGGDYCIERREFACSIVKNETIVAAGASESFMSFATI